MAEQRPVANLPATLHTWFDDHPTEWFRCQDIAHALGFARTHPVANECGRMYRKAQIARQRVVVKGRAQPVTYYGNRALAPVVPDATPEEAPTNA